MDHAHMATGRAELGYEPASDSNRQPVQKTRDTSGQDSEGGVSRKREALAARLGSAAAAAKRRLGGWYHVYPWGTVERCLQRGAETHGQDRVLFLCEKRRS